MLNDGFINADGVIQNNILNLDLIGSQIDLSATSIKAVQEKNVKGIANFTGKVLGHITDPYVLLDIKASNLVVNEGVLGELKGSVKVTSEMASLNDLILEDLTGEYKINGNITLSNNPYFDIVLSSKNVRAESMLKVASLNYPLTGFMEQEAKIRGTSDNIYAKGWVKLSKGSYDGYLMDEAFGDYEYRDGIIYVDGFTIKWLDSNIFLNGAIYPDNTLKLEVNATEINLVKMPIKYPYPITGWINIVGTVTGDFDNPVVDGRMTASRIVANGQILTGLTGKFDYKNRKINIEKLSMAQGHGFYEFQGYFNVDSKILKGDLNLKVAPVQGIMKLLKISNDHFSGDIDGEILVEGTFDKPAISVVGQINNSAVDRYEFGTVDINLYYKNKAFIINRLNAESENGSLVAEGMANLDGDIDIQISGNNLDSGLFSSLLNTTFDPKGKVDFSAIAQGKTRNPELTAVINIESYDKEESGFDNLSTVFSMKNAVLNIDKFQVDKGEYRLSAQGIVPLKALSKSSLGELSAHEQMNVKINLDNADLQILPLIFPEVDKATGKTYGTIDITGTLEKPQVNGSISIPQGSLKLADISDPITDIEVAILFEGEKINIETITGKMNKGSFVIAGNAFIKGIDVPNYDLVLIASNLKIDHKYFDGQVDSTLKVTNEGLNGRPLLKGNLDISNAVVDIPDFPESGSSVVDFDIDVDINIGKKVRLYNSSLYDLPVEGALKLRGTLQNPYLLGRLESKKGSVTYLATRFNVTEASADFSSVQKLIPNVNLSAKTRVGSVLINLNVRGPADDLRMHLSSEPQLSNEAIMKALTFGVDPTSIGSGAYQDSQNDQLMTLLAMGMQIQAVSKLEGFFRERADIDVFRIEPLSMFDYRSRKSRTEKHDSYYNYNLKIGKYLTDDILIMYNTGLVESNSSITVQYDLTPRITLSGTFGGLNNGLYTIETRFRF
ncbi:translocation/assembly module TamB domain-containing protein [Selenomonadales bacterium OttesenSCG-928-I06]|nr:translocation/assembly module TamB domain-containing protein [Selenomonadales bacterium OttesenSCG-928-I06]